MTLRKHFSAGFECQTPRGPEKPRLEPLRDGETNKRLTVLGKVRGGHEEVVKSSPSLKDW
eukprot:5586375-Pyramimonas_sp.AAC.1